MAHLDNQRSGVVCCQICRDPWASGQFHAPRGTGNSCPFDACPAPADLVVLPQTSQQRMVQSLSDTGLLPRLQATPTTHATAVAQFLRQVFPRDPCVQHEQDAVEHRSSSRGRPPLAERGTTGTSCASSSHNSSPINARLIMHSIAEGRFC